MDFDSVRAEKEEAMRNYNRQRNLKTFVRIATLFSLLVLLFSWSSPLIIPAAVEIAGEFFLSFKSVLYQRQYVFLLTNALVLAIYSLNHKNDDVAQPDLYDEYVSKSASSAANLHSPQSEMKTAVVNLNSGSPVKKAGNMTSALVVLTECSSPVTQPEIQVTKTGRLYRRSQSESFESRKVAMPGELRRSETENGREMVVGRQSMEEMSSEEFRIIVESFIAKKKKDLREEDIKNITHSHSGVGEP